MSVALTSLLHNLADWKPEEIAAAKAEVWNALGDLSCLTLWRTQVLVACYIRPPVTRSGIKIGSKTSLEDAYQGKVGMIVKFGATALAVPENVRPEDWLARFGGKLPEVGDLVWFEAAHGVQCGVRGPGGKKLRLETPNGELEDARDWSGWPCRRFYLKDIEGTVTMPGVIV